MEAADLETALAITPRFYPAALDFDLWPDILKDLNVVFGARASNLNLGHITRNELIASAQHGVDDGVMARFLGIENHLEADPRLQKTLHLPNRPLFERQVISEAEWHASRMYREVMLPAGLDSTLATHMVVEEEGVSALVGFIRGVGDPPFVDADIQRFHLYLPHFREAMRCAARMHRAEAGRGALAELFDWMRVATVVTDRLGAVKHLNAAARELIAEGDGLVRAQDRLVAVDRNADRELRDAILRAIAASGPDPARTLVRIPRRRHATDLLVSVARVRAGSGSRASMPRLLAALFVLDPERRYEGDAEALQRLFGLTRAEAAVMVAIGSGQRPREAGAALGRSYETVRSQLKAVYAKTGAASQADLVGLVQALAALRRP
ncbi:hypothetical protein [Amaricoccus sp.]|uniref:helix-turn-helix transcriptional regulator n=1 Tax=Amaricoccus sp. TaxID=1872485 RepID=UPI001B5C0857|nr:hypothetical protein [Amaricoccus sp.]MBP7001098.1 response regulator transcription factor [Amaricoccus sp.]